MPELQDITITHNTIFSTVLRRLVDQVFSGWQGVSDARALRPAQRRGRGHRGKAAHPSQVRDPLLHHFRNSGLQLTFLFYSDPDPLEQFHANPNEC